MDFRKHRAYDIHSGITNNPAESVNNIIKSIQKRRQLPVDMINLTLFFLQQYIFTEMQCGRAVFGNYRLKPEFAHAKIDASEIRVSKLKGSPDEILAKAKKTNRNFQSRKRKTSN